MRNRINLPDSMYPVESFFNAMRDKDIYGALDCFSRGHGFNIEGAGCLFPLDISEDLGGDESQYGYIEFWTYSGNEEVQVSFSDFMKFLGMVVDNEIEHSPDAKEFIREKMVSIGKKINEIQILHAKTKRETS